MIKIRVAVILIKDGKILLVRHSKSGSSYWVLPGGGVEKGESLAEAASREIKEEVNLKIKVKKLVFISEAIPPDGSRHVIDFFFTGDIISGNLVKGEEEILKELKFFPLHSLDDISFYPEIREEIKAGFKKGFRGPTRFLGNRWNK